MASAWRFWRKEITASIEGLATDFAHIGGERDAAHTGLCAPLVDKGAHHGRYLIEFELT